MEPVIVSGGSEWNYEAEIELHLTKNKEVRLNWWKRPWWLSREEQGQISILREIRQELRDKFETLEDVPLIGEPTVGIDRFPGEKGDESYRRFEQARRMGNLAGLSHAVRLYQERKKIPLQWGTRLSTLVFPGTVLKRKEDLPPKDLNQEWEWVKYRNLYVPALVFDWGVYQLRLMSCAHQMYSAPWTKVVRIRPNLPRTG